MIRSTIVVVCALTLAASAFAGENANPNGSKAVPGSSSAVTPAKQKNSPGTVGAMKNAGGGSFTASKADQKKVQLKNK